VTITFQSTVSFAKVGTVIEWI